jgi:hypothetical protein
MTFLEPKTANLLAEAKGFEPLVGCPTAVFKTAAFDHSATLPRAEMAESCCQVKGLWGVGPRLRRSGSFWPAWGLRWASWAE